jgi:hypothetical protein
MSYALKGAIYKWKGVDVKCKELYARSKRGLVIYDGRRVESQVLKWRNVTDVKLGGTFHMSIGSIETVTYDSPEIRYSLSRSHLSTKLEMTEIWTILDLSCSQ